MAAVAEKVKYTQDSFQDEKPGAIGACPFAGELPVAPTPPIEESAPEEVKIFPSVTETAAPPPAPVKKEEEKKAWIEIVLVDMDGNPMPGVRYIITPPSGEPKEGYLNEHGQGGYYEIEQGTCKVSFPDLDKDAWE